MPNLPRGFTLIELLVAMSIIMIVGTLVLIDFGPFRSNQNLQTAVLDLQNFIREAQVNASSGVTCPDKDAVEAVKPWKIVFSQKRVDLVCGDLTSSDRFLTFKPDIKLSGLEFGTASCAVDSMQLVFTPINGKVSFINVPGKVCEVSSPTTLKILVQYKDDAPKKLMINTGGVVNVE